MSQLITDFGRTNKLIESARLRAGSQKLQVDETRAEIRLEVDQAFYQALAADAVLSVSTATLNNRRLTLRQVRALALLGPGADQPFLGGLRQEPIKEVSRVAFFSPESVHGSA